MRPRVRAAFNAFGLVLDDLDKECLSVERKVQMGEPLSNADKGVLAQWNAEGAKPWRQKPKVMRRIKRAARKAARNKGNLKG
jgi:hypothetical protein